MIPLPATMMHLYAGYTLLPDGTDPFFLGCILPDCVDGDRTLKDHLHFRDVAPEERLMKLILFGKELTLSRPFDLGVLFHFYLDYLWDNGPQKAHRKRYTGENWFPDYRRELARAGSQTAQRMPWAKALWLRLGDATPEQWESHFSLPEPEIRSFLEFNVRWHTREALPESVAFPQALVDEFTLHACKAFRIFLSDFFPEETKNGLLS